MKKRKAVKSAMANAKELVGAVLDRPLRAEDGVSKEAKEMALEAFSFFLEKAFEEIGKEGTVEFLGGEDDVCLFAGKGRSYADLEFHLKECPGFLFGLSLGLGEETKATSYADVRFFSQYEANVDKFKPSRSPLLAEAETKWQKEDGDLPDEESLFYDDFGKLASFIRDQPELAFCRDLHRTDYNLEYISPEEAKRKMEAWLKEEEERKKLKERLNGRFIDWAKERIASFEGAEIKDRGENVSPKYEIEIPYEGNEGLFPDGKGDCFLEDVLPGYEALVEELEEEAAKEDKSWLADLYFSDWVRAA